MRRGKEGKLLAEKNGIFRKIKEYFEEVLE